MIRSLRPLVIIVPALLIACGPPYLRQDRDPREPTIKIVDAKRPPATLIAVDRSVCLVTAERYRNTRIGDAVFCQWSGGRPTALGSDRVVGSTPDPRQDATRDPRRATRGQGGTGAAQPQPARPPDR
jgi:hypothetical protein